MPIWHRDPHGRPDWVTYPDFKRLSGLKGGKVRPTSRNRIPAVTYSYS
jgi:hypothetical protein